MSNKGITLAAILKWSALAIVAFYILYLRSQVSSLKEDVATATKDLAGVVAINHALDTVLEEQNTAIAVLEADKLAQDKALESAKKSTAKLSANLSKAKARIATLNVPSTCKEATNFLVDETKAFILKRQEGATTNGQ